MAMLVVLSSQRQVDILQSHCCLPEMLRHDPEMRRINIKTKADFDSGQIHVCLQQGSHIWGAWASVELSLAFVFHVNVQRRTLFGVSV